MADMESTRIKKDVKERLAALGNVDDTYNDVIEKLLDHYEKCPEVKEEKT